MLKHHTLSLAVLAASLTALIPACKAAPDSPTLVGSVRKLGGAPARVEKLRFAPDGRSVFALERRSPDPGPWSAGDKYAITQRPVAGGNATEIFVSNNALIDFAPLGDGVVVMSRPRLPPPLPTLPDESRERRDIRRKLEVLQALAIKGTALHFVASGQSPRQISPEGTRCFSVVGAAGGQWVAVSSGDRNDSNDSPEWATVHVYGANLDEQHTLTRKGLVYDVSPDGARVLLVRRFSSNEPPKLPIFDMSAVSMVIVKDELLPAPLPTSLQLDGTEIKTEGLAVAFAGEGLVFQSPQGDFYRSALDGSKAVRVAGASPAPPERPRRVLSPRGAVIELSENAGAVEMARPLIDSEHPRVVSVRLEGPLAGLGPAAVDATGGHIAFAALSDTSRDGRFDAIDDDATVFVTDAAQGSLALERAPMQLLADELRPKVASAIAIAPSSIGIVHSGSTLEVTAELPWIDGEKAQALVDRMLVAARAIEGAVGPRNALLRLRIGPLDVLVAKYEKGGLRPYVAVRGSDGVFPDPEALPLVLHNPVLASTIYSSERSFAGTLENNGKTSLGPIELILSKKPDLADLWYDSLPVYSPYFPSVSLRELDEIAAMIEPGKRAPSKRSEIKETIGIIEPGKRVSCKLAIWPKGDFDMAYLAEGKPITVFNKHLQVHSLDWLSMAIGIRAEHGVWPEYDPAKGTTPAAWRVKLTERQAALPDGERSALLLRIEKALHRHNDAFHDTELLRIRFAAPGGGGWYLADGGSLVRYEHE